MTRLDGKVAVVTGGAGGLGKETAKLFLQEGAKVLLVDLSEEALLKTKEELNDYGEIITVRADVSQESDTVNYVKTAVDHWGKIDVFFNNAGIEGEFSSFVETTVENFDQVMNVNVRGVFLGMEENIMYLSQQTFQSALPTNVIFGINSVKESLTVKMKELNKSKVFIATDPGLVQAGIPDKIQSLLKENGIGADYIFRNRAKSLCRNGHEGGSSL